MNFREMYDESRPDKELLAHIREVLGQDSALIAHDPKDGASAWSLVIEDGALVLRETPDGVWCPVDMSALRIRAEAEYGEDRHGADDRMMELMREAVDTWVGHHAVAELGKLLLRPSADITALLDAERFLDVERAVIAALGEHLHRVAFDPMVDECPSWTLNLVEGGLVVSPRGGGIYCPIDSEKVRQGAELRVACRYGLCVNPSFRILYRVEIDRVQRILQCRAVRLWIHAHAVEELQAVLRNSRLDAADLEDLLDSEKPVRNDAEGSI